MELIWNEVEAERLVMKTQTQVRVSGALPDPNGNTPTEVLDCSARVVVDSSEAGTDEVRLSGRVLVTVTVTDAAGKVYAYESKAGFEHSLNTPGTGTGMTCRINPVLQSVSASPYEGGVQLEADLELEVFVFSSVPLKVVSGVSGVSDLEIKEKRIAHRRKKVIGTSTLRMREEIAAEDAADVVSCFGQVLIREVTVEQGAASISGVITVSAVIKDSSDRISQLVRQIPFRERVGVSKFDGEIFCSAVLDSLYMRALGEDFALISMEAETSFTVYSIETSEISLPLDAFSPTVCFDCLKEEYTAANCLGIYDVQTTIKENVPLPDGASEIGAPLFASASPTITETEFVSDGALVKGVISTTLVYSSTADKLTVIDEDVPFSLNVECPAAADMAIISPSCIASITGTADRSFQVQFNLLLNSEYYETMISELAAGLAEKEKTIRKSGVVISFASEGEEIFDIAKRYSVSSDTVKAFNPDLKEPLSDGERILLIV